MDSVRELLSDARKGVKRAQGVLCYLFRNALIWRRVDQFSWNRRLRLYFEKPHNRNNPDKGNLNKALIQDDFTWGTFKKAIDFLDPVSATFTVILTWRSGLTSSYTMLIDPSEDESDPALNTFDFEESEVFAAHKKPANALSRLFHRIVSTEGIDLTRWNALFEEYAKNPFNGIPENRRERNASIAALQRDLLAPRMSWTVFRRGLLVLNPIQEEYILTLHWSHDPNVGPEEPTVLRAVIRDPFATGKPYEHS